MRLTPTAILSAAILVSACVASETSPTLALLPSGQPTLSPTPFSASECPPEGSAPTLSVVELGDPWGLSLAILDYLNHRGSAEGLEESLNALTTTIHRGGGADQGNLRARVFSHEVTGDSSPEVLVSLAIPGYWGEDEAVLAYACQANKYVQLVDEQDNPVLGAGQIQAIADLNQNGVEDVVSAGYEVSVLEWDGERLARLPFGLPEEGSGRIREVQSLDLWGGGASVKANAAGVPELVLTIGIESESKFELGMARGPQRERTEIWTWNGSRLMLIDKHYEPPRYRFQAVQDGDDELHAGAYAEALAWYQQVLDDESLLGWSRDQRPDTEYAAFGYPATPTPDPQERIRLTAYVHFRMLVLWIAQRDLGRAQAAYEKLQAEASASSVGRGYAELATVFWDEYKRSNDLVSACREAVDYATNHATDLLIPLSGDFYGSHNRGYLPEDICPFGQAEVSLTPTPPALASPQSAPTITPSAATVVPTRAEESTVGSGFSPAPEQAIGRPSETASACPAPSGPLPPIVLSDAIDPLEAQILAYLNARGSAVGLRQALNQLQISTEQGWVLSVHSLVLSRDITGDMVPEIVVELTLPGGTASAILILGCDTGRFQRIAVYKDELANGSEYSFSRAFRLLAITDMNLNGVAEIVFHHSAQENCGVHSFCATETHIVEWDGLEFTSLVVERHYDDNYYDFIHTDGYERYLVTDTDEDGILEFLRMISLTGGLSLLESGGVPQRDLVEIWAWNGQAFALARTEPGPPIFRIHAVYDADEAAQAGDYARALGGYQRAISDDALMSWGPGQDGLAPQQRLGDPYERQRLTAYALYRLIVLQSRQGNPGEAQAIYEKLQSQFPPEASGFPYVELAAAFWEEYQSSLNVAAACSKAVAFASGHILEILAPLSGDFYDPYDLDFNGFFSRDYTPEGICPFK